VLASPLHRVILLSTLSHVAFTGARLSVSLTALHAGASPLSVGVLMSLFAALPLLLSVKAGRAVDRLGVRRVMLLGSLLVAVGTALPFVIYRSDTLFFAATIIGTGFMCIHISVFHAVGMLGTAETRAIDFSLLGLGFSVSGFVGPLVAGFTIDHVSHRAAFALLTLFPLISAAVLWRAPWALPGQQVLAHEKRQGHILELLQVRELRDLYLISAALSLSWDVFNFAVPIHATRVGLSASEIGAILGSFALATFSMRVVLPSIARRMSEWPVLLRALAVTGVTYLVFPFATSLLPLMLLAFLLGVALGAPQPMLMSVLHAATPPHRVGEAIGLRTSLINLSQTAMPLLFGALGSVVGMTPVFLGVAGALAGGCTVALPHARKQRRPAAR
jgi:MFS family permease